MYSPPNKNSYDAMAFSHDLSSDIQLTSWAIQQCLSGDMPQHLLPGLLSVKAKLLHEQDAHLLRTSQMLSKAAMLRAFNRVMGVLSEDYRAMALSCGLDKHQAGDRLRALIPAIEACIVEVNTKTEVRELIRDHTN